MRMGWVRAVAMVMLAALVGRLGYLSVVQGKQFAKQAMAQRTEKVVIKNTRGILYDRNMRKLTDTGQEIAQVDGIAPLYVSKRYHDGLLSHVVGYLTEDGGGFGVEKAFDELLKGNQPSTVSLVKDANNRLIEQFGYVVSEQNVYQGIKLTIDYYIQTLTEQAMDEEGIDGAAIVLEADSGHILAMASRPNFDQNRVADYLDSNKGELVNRALSSYDIGSVFKILMAAAALESGFSNEMLFECTGHTDVDGLDFVCQRKEGHGTLSMQEGFALSCNSVFYNMGLQMGIEPIYDYATAFGLGERVLNINGMAERKGNIPSGPIKRRALANVSIGQGDVQATPLQVADMVCTILNDGQRKQLTLIKGLVDEQGQCVDVKPVTLGRIVASDTARMVANMMVQAVHYGTGTGASVEGWGAGGKTGSAQTGWQVDGTTMTHGWFVGFFPEKNPRYVCVVVAENGRSGSDSAVPVFRKIAQGMKDLGL